MKTLLVLFLLLLGAGSANAAAAAAPVTAPRAASVGELDIMSKRFAPVALTADVAALSAGDKAAIAKLIDAAKIIDVLQLRQR